MPEDPFYQHVWKTRAGNMKPTPDSVTAIKNQWLHYWGMGIQWHGSQIQYKKHTVLCDHFYDR